MQYRVRKPLSSTIVDYNVLNPCIACVVYKTTQLIDIFIITLYVRVNKYVYIYIYIYYVEYNYMYQCRYYYTDNEINGTYRFCAFLSVDF